MQGCLLIFEFFEAGNEIETSIDRYNLLADLHNAWKKLTIVTDPIRILPPSYMLVWIIEKLFQLCNRREQRKQRDNEEKIMTQHEGGWGEYLLVLLGRFDPFYREYHRQNRISIRWELIALP